MSEIAGDADREKSLRAALMRPWWQLRFTDPAIEDEFIHRLRQTQEKLFVLNAWLALFFYNLFSISDWFLLPDVVRLAWSIRWLIISPLVVMMLVYFRRSSSESKRELFMSLAIVLAGFGITIPFVVSLASGSTVVHWGMLIVMLFALTVHFRFIYTLASSLVLCAIYAIAILVKFSITPEAFFALVVMVSVTSLVLLTGFRQEKNRREAFVMMSLLQLDRFRQAEVNEKLEHLVDLDPLTELPNRRRFDKEYPRIWRDAVRKRTPLSLLFVDIDHFKAYNDAYGHAQGDICLRTVAALLLGLAARRPLDLAIRNGGEEFLVLLPETAPEVADEIAEQFRLQLEALEIIHRGSSCGFVTASVGVAGGIPAVDTKPADYIESADRAMYRAKRNGRNRVEMIAL